MPDYAVESGASVRARQRRRRSLLTIGLLLLALFFAFWYAYSYYRDSEGKKGSDATSTACQTPGAGAIAPRQVKVNVYNATKRAGLAARTAQSLRSKGYQVGSVTNDPKGKTVTGAAEVRFGPAGASRARLVAGVTGGKTALVKDSRADASVDLVLGNAFTGLSFPSASPGRPTCPPSS